METDLGYLNLIETDLSTLTSWKQICIIFIFIYPDTKHIDPFDQDLHKEVLNFWI